MAASVMYVGGWVGGGVWLKNDGENWGFYEDDDGRSRCFRGVFLFCFYSCSDCFSREKEGCFSLRCRG